MPLLNRHFVQIALMCAVAAMLALPASAQTVAKKKVIRGESMDDPATPATNTTPVTPALVAKITPAPTTGSGSGSGTVGKDGVQSVEFTKLCSFEYIVPDLPNTNQMHGTDIADKQIPAEIKALDQKKVTLTGYLMPLKEEEGKCTEFLLMRTQSSCCFGIAPTITELVTVKSAGKGVPTIMDDLIEVQGTLKVGTVREDGYIVGVYQMDEGKFMGRSDR